jgi:hypothetical protein
VNSQQVLVSSGNRRHTLPILVFLLAVAYGVMTFVLMQQGNVIQSQRYLIQQLFDDSKKLSTLKAEESKRKHAAEIAKNKASQPNAARKPGKPVEQPPMQAVDKTDTRRSLVKI